MVKMAGTLFKELGSYGQDVVDLAIASPDSDILGSCKDGMEVGTMHCLATHDSGDIFQYGTRKGNLELRQTLASFLTENYDHGVSSDRLFITNGSSQGLILLYNVLFQAGDFVFVEDPTDYVSLEIFSELGLKIISVPSDDNGVIVEDLDKLLKVHSQRKRPVTEKKPFWGFLYIMTNFKNPTGQCLSEARSSALIDIFHKYEVLCVCDDTLTCLSYPERSPPFKLAPKRLLGYDPSSKSDEDCGNVVSVGSFSTIFCPGLRLGWLEASSSVLNLLKNSALVRHVGTSQQYLGGVVSSAIELDYLTRHLSFLKITYHDRLNSLLEALCKYLPKTVKFLKPQGGLFVWLTLPERVDANDLLKVCREKYRVGFSPGSKFSVTPAKYSNCLRLSIAHYNEEILVAAVERLATALSEFL